MKVIVITFLLLVCIVHTRKYYGSYSRSYNKINKPAYTYILNLEGGKKYVGYTQSPKKRICDHFNGKGAKWTQKHRPVSINSIIKYNSVSAAKRGETKEYYKAKAKYGKKNVRGAGYTRSF